MPENAIEALVREGHELLQEFEGKADRSKNSIVRWHYRRMARTIRRDLGAMLRHTSVVKFRVEITDNKTGKSLMWFEDTKIVASKDTITMTIPVELEINGAFYPVKYS